MKGEIFYYEKINHAIQILLNSFKEKNVEIAIYPYGYVGQYVKKILNDVYGIQETYIFDKTISKYNRGIKWFDDISEEKLKEMAVIVACENASIYDEVWDTCKKYFREENIFSVFTKVCMARDVRVEALRLNAEYIKKMQVKGNVAEFGVYRGNFCREINKYFGDRIPYMFDTFEGFQHKQLKSHVENRFMAELDSGTDYCVVDDYDNILKGFKHPENCRIRKGYFPDTTVGIEDTFCFVSIDVDIYTSTKAGLEFFWPRMESNGIIMVHDYNYTETLGVKSAVDEFARAQDAKIIMLPDYFGSAVMVK